jgi:radical SAM superfamily enzyme YgiQ (UPF0313 family)
MHQMQVLLLSTYELGHQPFGLASPAAWLRAAGAQVTCLDLAMQQLEQQALANASLVAIYVPMHTATRLAAEIIKDIKQRHPHIHVCCYGLYAPMNEAYLRTLGVDTVLGGEFEQGLVTLYQRLAKAKQLTADVAQPEPRISLDKQVFLIPDRSDLPSLDRYAWIEQGNTRRTAGYTEASRGCKHLCRHCPIVPVYGGRFRVVQRDVVLADVRQQVAAGAQHITFGDPDFFNGPGHAIPLVKALHAEFPGLTYDVTIKIEHLLQHAQHLSTLRDTGCILVTSAVEAVDDKIVQIFDKRHTKADLFRVVALFREVGLALNPTFVTFTLWTTLESYVDFLATIKQLDLIENVSPIQYAIRLLIPEGSKLLELPEVQALVGAYDEAALCYRWDHPDPRVDQLYADVLQVVKRSTRQQASRQAVFEQVWAVAHAAASGIKRELPASLPLHANRSRTPIPQLSEPWYC